MINNLFIGYRFTNTHVAPPPGVHTVAVEAIFDTGREVLPHELLWDSLQTAFASDGHLRLVPQARADALVRAHIRDARVMPAGDNNIIDTAKDGSRKIKDPVAFSHDLPPVPSSFRHITQTDVYSSRADIKTVVDVEVVNLNTHQVLLKRTYDLLGEFQAIHAAGGLTLVNNDHLRYLEAADARFKQMADGIANAVVQTLLVH